MGTREKVYIFNSFFWAKLEKAGYIKGALAKWTKKVDIFGKDAILIPINIGNVHWAVAVINLRLKRIEVHDSVDLNHADVFQRLREYLDLEHRNKHNIGFDFAAWEDFTSPKTPRQTNTYDCGIFACQFLRYLASSARTLPFTQDDMPDLRERMVVEIQNPRLLS
ncbi:hypothetical protein B0H14DRAFT_2440795 [Mycena olivaceomarginata]|nr:hypothetical protein B0H14DRAFT_2440795 [Mycena olivaceomarginata]